MNESRRGFFKSFSAPFNQKDDEWRPIRPPYNRDKSLFQKECISCEEKPCVAVCDEEIIKISDDGTVYLDFSKRGCTYCDECALSCQKGVLLLDSTNSNRIDAHIELDMTKCVAWHGVICSSCSDVCYDRAIKFLGMLRPEINYENCTNCGFCVGVCPSYAISAIAKE